jgi:hypothetical protein
VILNRFSETRTVSFQGRLVKERHYAGLVMIAGNRREAEDSVLALRPLVVSQTARFEDGVSTVVSWLRPPLRPEACEETDRTER